MKNSNFEEMNQVLGLANQDRFKILLALFNSDFKFNGKKLGKHSHNLLELTEILDIDRKKINGHLDILLSLDLVIKLEDHKGYYHITEKGKNILQEFGVTKELVNETGNRLNA